MSHPVPASVRSYVVKFELVGSRVTCSPPPTDTDQDVLVFVQDKDFAELDFLLDQEGFSAEGSRPTDGFQIDAVDSFQSFRLDDVNLIVTANEEFYRRFLAASSIAKRLNLLDKADRIALFQAVLYGNPDNQS